MALDLATLDAAVRAWVSTAIADATVLVLAAHGSAPRSGVPFVTVYRTGIASPEWDEARPIRRDAITAVNTAARRFTVAGDRRLYYVAGRGVQVASSTGNDGSYIVASATFAAGSTEVVVVEAVPSAVADGHLTGVQEIFGTRYIDYQIDSIGGDAMGRAETIRSALALTAIREALATAGLAIGVAQPIQDLTELLDTEREPRAVFTVRFLADSVLAEYVGIVERATVRTVMDHPDGTLARDETFTADINVPPPDPG